MRCVEFETFVVWCTSFRVAEKQVSQFLGISIGEGFTFECGSHTQQDQARDRRLCDGNYRKRKRAQLGSFEGMNTYDDPLMRYSTACQTMHDRVGLQGALFVWSQSHLCRNGNVSSNVSRSRRIFFEKISMKNCLGGRI